MVKLPATASHADTYGSWSSSNPVRLAFDLTHISNIISATLTVWGFDVESPSGELDLAVVNGHIAGILTGQDNLAIVNQIAVRANYLVAGMVNTFSIFNPNNDTGNFYGFLVYNSIDPLTHTDRRAFLTIETTSVPGPIAGAGLPIMVGLAGVLAWRQRRGRSCARPVVLAALD
jgi:hypothetical protein